MTTNSIRSFQYSPVLSISYADFGPPSGFPVFVQHGMIASIKDQWLFGRLAEAGLRVICAARPGYGDSTPRELGSVGEWGAVAAALADSLGLGQLDVLGISSGAPYAYATAARMPGRARRVYILSGTPALFDERVLSHWPYPVDPRASLPALQALAYNLFFAGRSPHEPAQDDAADSMRNDCFGVALDLMIRCQDWGFRLAEVQAPVYMRHSRADASVPFATAELTAALLPHCRLDAREADPHFSQEVLDDFLAAVVTEVTGGER